MAIVEQIKKYSRGVVETVGQNIRVREDGSIEVTNAKEIQSVNNSAIGPGVSATEQNKTEIYNSDGTVKTYTDGVEEDVRVDTDPNSIEIDGESYTEIEEDEEAREIYSTSKKLSPSKVDSIVSTVSHGIFGMPYQFSKEVDARITGDREEDFGIMYFSKIISVMPVMFITPGEPQFIHNDLTKKQKAERDSMINLYEDNSDLTVDDIVDGKTSLPFYTFKSTFLEYVKYVNPMVRALALFMGMQHEEYYDADGNTRELWAFNLEHILNKDFARLFNANTSLAIYLDAENSVSESFSNNTTESMLSQKVNSLSDTAKELSFLMGSAGVGNLYDTLNKAVSDSTANIGQALGELPIAGGVIRRITSSLATVVTGGKIIFPEIWSSSDFSRSYSINIKLRSPDNDPMSILFNIYIPCCCLAALALPRQIKNKANDYSAPFLVRATYKSIFNCQLGIVSSLTFNKGGEDKWNAMGMPTQVDVTMEIKDLYSTLFMSKMESKNGWTGLTSNVGELDYLSLMAGLDMNKSWYTKNVQLTLSLLAGEVANIPSMVWNTFLTGANRKASNFLSKALGADVRFVS